MNITEALTITVALGSVVAIVVETAIKDPRAFGEIATDVEAFARRRPERLVQVPATRRGFYVAGMITTAVLLVLFA
jgi:hypothetical protein